MHEGAAFLSLLFMQITRGVAWLALWHRRRASQLPRWLIGFLLLLSLLTVATVGRAAALGGEILTIDPAWSTRGAARRSAVFSVAALMLWIGVMFWGSMLPFIGDAF